MPGCEAEPVYNVLEENDPSYEEVHGRSGTVRAAERAVPLSEPLYNVLEGAGPDQKGAEDRGHKEPLYNTLEDPTVGGIKQAQPAPSLAPYSRSNLGYESVEELNVPQDSDGSDEAPDYDILEGPDPSDEAPNSVSQDHDVLEAPDYNVLEEPNPGDVPAESPDYDVLEGPDPTNPSQVYGSLARRQTETYAALRKPQRPGTSQVEPQDDRDSLYQPLGRTGDESMYQSVDG